MTTGSLGQGFSAAMGIAQGLKMDKRDVTVYTAIGDGESNEGQVWEAAMFASQRKLSNIIAFTDCNKQQLDGLTSDIMSMEPFEDKWKAFGWFTQRVDGHDIGALDAAIGKAKEQAKAPGGKPSMIVMDTVKGKGCSFAEGVVPNHNMTYDMAKAAEAVAALG
jgi:transketolase